MEEKKTRLRERKTADFIEEIKKKWEDNPIVQQLEDIPVEPKTNKEHIRELQEILVQTCIDYINKNGLTDIYSVSFSADDLNTSAEYGEWTPATDSYIRIRGINKHRFVRKNGDITEIPFWYDIGENL